MQSRQLYRFSELHKYLVGKKDLIGFSNSCRNYLNTNPSIMHILGEKKESTSKVLYHKDINEMGGLVNQIFANTQNKAPRLNFADFVYNVIDDWYKLAIVIGCLEVKDSYLKITITDGVLGEMYRNKIKDNNKEMQIRKFIQQVQTEGMIFEFRLDLKECEQTAEGWCLLFENLKSKYLVGQMRENLHSIYMTNGDGEYCKNKSQLSKEELREYITGDCYNGMIK